MVGHIVKEELYRPKEEICKTDIPELLTSQDKSRKVACHLVFSILKEE